MTAPISDEQLDGALATLDYAPAVWTPELVRGVDALASALRDEGTREITWRQLRRPTARDRVRRARWSVLGIIAVLVAGFGAAPATASVSQWLAHTGLFGTNFSHTKAGATAGTGGDTSEWIGLDATDANKALAGLYPGYLVLPAAVTRDDAIRTIIRLNVESLSSGDAASATHVEEQATGIRETYEFFANCAWYSDWLSAKSAGDAARLSTDTAGISTAAGFPALASSSPEVTTRLTMFAKDAVVGNRGDIVEAATELGCSGFLRGLHR